MGSWRREKASAGHFRGSIMEEVVSLHLKQLVEVRKEHFFQRSGGGRRGFFFVDYTRNVITFGLHLSLNCQSYSFSASFRDLSQAKLGMTGEWPLDFLSRLLW